MAQPELDTATGERMIDITEAESKSRITATTDADVISAIDNGQLRGKVVKDLHTWGTIAYVSVSDLNAWRASHSSSAQSEGAK